METIEINQVLPVLKNMMIFTSFSAVGVYTKGMIFPELNNFRAKLGLSLLTSIIFLTVTYIFEIDILLMMIISPVVGFFIPSFKDWFKGKKIIKILFKGYRRAKKIQDAIEEGFEKEFDKKD